MIFWKFLISVPFVYSRQVKIHGADDIARYSQPVFMCQGISDIKYIKAEYLNDNICDCEDGSDEPGTSACMNSKFLCMNAEFESKKISTMFVNDGICDCCDGSDEYNGKTRCINTCAEQKSRKMEELRLLKKKEQMGSEELIRLIDAGTKKFAEAQIRVSLLKNELSVAEARAALMRFNVEKAEATEKQIELEDSKLGRLSHLSLVEQIKRMQNAIVEVKKLVESTDQTDAKEIIEQLKTITSQINPNDLDELPIVTDAQDPYENMGFLDRFKKSIMLLFNPAVLKPLVLAQEHVKRAENELKEFMEAKSKIENEIAELEKITEIKVPNPAYYALKDVCVSLEYDNHQYELCYMGKITQKDKNGFNDVTIGVYNSQESNNTVWNYNNGYSCWNGATRSAIVLLSCGAKTEIIKIKEPIKCFYELMVDSPVACSKSDQNI